MLDRHGHGLPPYDRMAPGPIKGLQLVAAGIEQARAELVGRGIEVGAVEDVGGGVKYARVADPDGNTLTLQEMALRAGDKSPSLIAISSDCAESDSGRAFRSSGGPDVSPRAFTRTRMRLQAVHRDLDQKVKQALIM